MPFRDPIVAGVTLVRDAIQSRNYVVGSTGWTINADGSAEFNNVVIRGTIIASDFRSSNYVAGTTGFDINAITNVVEFNTGVRVGGVGGVGSPNVLIGLVAPGAPGFTFHTSAVTETIPGSMEAGVVAGFPLVEIDGPTTNNGHSFLQVAGSTTTLLGGIVLGDNSSPVAGNTILSSALIMPPYMQAQLQSVQPISNAENALILGNGAGTHMRLSNTQIQAITGGNVAGLLTLNPAGGNVNLPTPGAQGLIVGATTGANVTVGFNQIWALNNGAAADLFLNFSSLGNVNIGNNTAGGAQLIARAMAPTTFSTGSAGGAITSTTYVSSNALGSVFTMPASGRCMIHYGARANMTSTADQRGLWTFQIQQTNSAGAVIRAAVDIEACEAPVINAASANAGRYNMGKSIYVTGTPGNTIFVVMCARVTAATATITLDNVYIALQPLP